MRKQIFVIAVMATLLIAAVIGFGQKKKGRPYEITQDCIGRLVELDQVEEMMLTMYAEGCTTVHFTIDILADDPGMWYVWGDSPYRRPEDQ